MKTAIGNDHTAIEMKDAAMDHLLEKEFDVLNLRTDSPESRDYPVYGEKVGRAVVSGETDSDIVICGTGVGISLAASKAKGVRTHVCSESYMTKLSRMYNDSNVLMLGARVIGIEMAKMTTDEWLDAEYQDGRHRRRVGTVMDIESR